ncbi:MAG: molybdopterin synthase [Halobacteria archaeon]|nr:molybdopterin synthase [Halobacteria archaeon]
MKVLGVVGQSDSGKTSLIERLVGEVDATVATVKSIHHDIDVDEEGKDTYRHSDAGAETVVGVTPSKSFEITQARDSDQDDVSKSDRLSEHLDRLADGGYDYVLVEGFKHSRLPKVVLGDLSHDDLGGDAVLSADKGSDVDVTELLDVVDDLEEYETVGSLVRRAKSHPDSPKAGAVATFTGRVRVENHEDAETTHLRFEKYEGVADERLDSIRSELKQRDGVYEVLMYHKTGVVEGEEDIVHVVVLAGHRQEAFETVEDGINRLKDEVPIFKKEVTESGDYWVHSRP